MLSPTAATVRLFLHVIASAIWVGGQFALAGVVPVLRKTAPDAMKPVARAFARVAWPAFGVIVATGLWNLVEVSVGDASTEYQVTIFVKLCIVAASGIAAFLHTQATTKQGLAVWGAVGGLATILSLFLGVLLRTSAA